MHAGVIEEFQLCVWAECVQNFGSWKVMEFEIKIAFYTYVLTN